MSQVNVTGISTRRNIHKTQSLLIKDLKRNKYIYLMILPVIAYYLVFHYWPMYGATIAFKNFSLGKGINGSEWIGFKYFLEFFNSHYFFRVLKNTISINFYQLIFGFPIPIVFAILLNEVRSNIYKRTVQTISYMPHFISTMVVAGIIVEFTSRNGVINDILGLFGATPANLLTRPELFQTIFVGSEIWQKMGWESIIYLAALTSIDQELYQAAIIDGAGRFKQILHVTLPGILPTITILLILQIGRMMNVGFEKIILLYNPTIYETADVISSFVYRKGLVEFNFSYSTAVGLFNSVINFALLVVANWTSRRMSETSLW